MPDAVVEEYSDEGAKRVTRDCTLYPPTLKLNEQETALLTSELGVSLAMTRHPETGEENMAVFITMNTPLPGVKVYCPHSVDEFANYVEQMNEVLREALFAQKKLRGENS